MIPEFQFDHCVYPLSESVMNEEGLSYAYSKCANFMRFKTRPDVGLTILITPKWFFCTLLTQPYCNAPDGNPVFMNGLDFCGLFSLQLIEEVYPATAGYDLKQPTVTEAFETSTYLP